MLFVIFQLDTLKVGDVLQINFIGYDFEVKTIIDNDGYALIQPFGYFKLANLDLISAQDSIFERIKDIYPLAKVSIVILNKMSPKVYITTNVGISSVIDYQKGMTIKFLLFSSGKFSKRSIERVLLIRDNKAMVIKENDYDIQLMPNDILEVHIKEEFKWQDLLPITSFIMNLITLLVLFGVISPK
ncbi:MAG: hypothetical protein ABIL89_00025 [candidate division WOR-3 bacterium]